MMAADIAMDNVEDERQIELDAMSAIFPEIEFDEADRFTASIDIPVVPTTPVHINFTGSSDDTPPHDPAILDPDQDEAVNLSHLPSLHLQIILPEGYPFQNSPIFHLSTNPSWLSSKILSKLEKDGYRMWKEFGQDQVVYAYIDHLQQASENAFGVLNSSDHLEIPQDLKISLLDYDMKEKRAAFDKETFDCGICLDPKKGSVCHRMLNCGHVFCCQCLQNFYTNAITEGDIVSIRCLAPNCAKQRAAATAAAITPPGTRRKAKTSISPGELLQIPIEYETVRRYVKLKHKAALESDKNTVYCPRKWCQGAARSKKHRKPNLEMDKDDSGDDELEDDTGPPNNEQKVESGDDLLSICEDCAFAFCSRCNLSWHGALNRCKAQPPPLTELSPDEKATLEYLETYSTPCPTCAAPSQKTHGCNHMICFRCNSHYCYLCSSWLLPDNPYQHFNTEGMPCYQRLWELEEGDGVGLPARRAPLGEFIQDVVDEDSDDDEDGDNDDDNDEDEDANNDEDNNDDEAGDIVAEGPAPIALDQDIFREVLPPHRRRPARNRFRHRNEVEVFHNAVIEEVRLNPGHRFGEIEREHRLPRLEPVNVTRERPPIHALEGPVRLPWPLNWPPPAPEPPRAAEIHPPERDYPANWVQPRRPQPARRAGGRGAGWDLGIIRRLDDQELDALDDGQREWLQQFVNMALDDQEDEIEWDSGDDEDWEIPEH